MKKLIFMLVALITTAPSQAMFNDNPWLTKVVSEFEYLQDDGVDVLKWNIDAWYGRDLSKFWIKSAGEYAGSELQSANIEIVNSRAVSAYWDQQFGIRHDFKPDQQASDTRTWLSYGFIGTAAYFVDVDARLFVGQDSSSQLLIEAEREIMLTQQWVLTPEIDIVANGRSSDLYQEGSGLAEIEFGLRLGYEHRGNRKFQPFVGLSARQTFGQTKRIAKRAGQSSGEVQAMLGVHSWF